jgi:hypothetical protein
VIFPGPGDCPTCAVGDWCRQRGCPWYCSRLCRAAALVPAVAVSVSPSDPLVFVPLDRLDASKLPTDTLYLAPAEALNSALISRSALAQLPTNTLALAPAAAFANLPMDALAQVQPITPTTGTQDFLSLVPTMTLQISQSQLVIPVTASGSITESSFTMAALPSALGTSVPGSGRSLPHYRSRCDRCRQIGCAGLCKYLSCCRY